MWKVRRQLSMFLLPCGIQELHPGHQAWCHVPFILRVVLLALFKDVFLLNVSGMSVVDVYKCPGDQKRSFDILELQSQVIWSLPHPMSVLESCGRAEGLHVAVHTCNPGIGEVEPGGFLGLSDFPAYLKQGCPAHLEMWCGKQDGE